MEVNSHGDTVESIEMTVNRTAHTGALESGLRDLAHVARERVVHAANAAGHEYRCNPHGRSAFHTACVQGHADVVAFLLGLPGVAINLIDSNGRTPLHSASQDVNDGRAPGRAAIVKLLLAAPGININSVAFPGMTPLTLAVERGNCPIARLLVRHGARTHDVPSVQANLQPAAWARSQGHPDIADFLDEVHAAGGICKYRAEPRLRLLLLRALCLRGRASVVGHPAEEEGVLAQHTARRRLLYEWLFGSASQPATCDDDDNDGGARATPSPRLAGVPGGTDSGPLRLILEFWWSP